MFNDQPASGVVPSFLEITAGGQQASTILDFQILPLSADSYTLIVCERGSSRPLASCTFSHRIGFLTDFSVDRLNASSEGAAKRFDELQKLGRELYQKLFPPAVEQVWNEYKRRSEFLILCLRIAESAARLEVLPWETLHDGAEFIIAGAKMTVSRLPLDVAPQSDLPPIPRPLKLFGFFASPLDLGDHERLSSEREQEILLEAINDPHGQRLIAADFEDEAKLEILKRSLRDGYHILHFTGHGISPHDGGGLLLEDAHGKKLPASIPEVIQAVKSGVDNLRLAVISGCQTARTLHTGAFNDMSRELLRQGVPAVIAMQFSISDEGGLKFAEVLYREIANGVELERAVHTARRMLLEEKRFSINNDALAIVLLTADGACLRTAEAEATPPRNEPCATYLGDRLDPLAHGFYGRRREYRKIRDSLLHHDQRAIIIHGIGGIGKTALLTHTVNRLRRRFKGVMSFDCRHAALAPETILLELHRYLATQGMPQLQSLVGQSAPPEQLADKLARTLAQWPMLIVFDNFESQLDERREIASIDLRVFLTTLLRATGAGSRFLFTTRYLFDLDGERPGNLQELPLGDLSRPEALMLMQKLPNLAQAAYHDKLAVLEKFGGHPYALITLDRHCSHQSLDQALQDASLVKSELCEFLAIELNYRRLPERARELLNRLAAFRHPVPTEAAGWVMGEEISQADEIERILASLDRDTLPDERKLRDDAALRAQIEAQLPKLRSAPNLEEEIGDLIEWGLLTPVGDESGVQALAVHSLVREFLLDRRPSERWRSCLRDAAAFYTKFSQRLSAEHGDLTAALAEMEAFELLIEAEEYAAAANLLGRNSELLGRWGFWRNLESQYRRMQNKVTGTELGMVLHHLSIIYRRLGEYDKALACHEQSLRLAEEFDNRPGVAASLHQLGVLYQVRGEYNEALQRYEQSLEIMEELGDQANAAKSLHQMGIIHAQRGEYTEALQRFKQSLRINEALGNHASLAGLLHSMGNLHSLRREYDEAMPLYEKSLRIAEELGDRVMLAGLLHQIGMLKHLCGQQVEALTYYEQSLRIKEELGSRADLASTLHHIGVLYQQCSEYAQALSYYEQSLRILEELGDRTGIASSLGQIGQIFIETGRYAEAFPPLLNSLDALLELQSPYASLTVDDLRELRAKWGEQAFDAAWRKTTNQEPPEWLNEELPATVS